MALFNVPKRAGKSQDKAVAGKSKTRTKAPTTMKSGLLGQISQIIATVEKYLGKYKDDYEIITSKERLKEYIDICIANDIISIDNINSLTIHLFKMNRW